MPLARDLLHPTLTEEKRKCKLKRLVPSPNSQFWDVKCPGCYTVKIVFSHVQVVVKCDNCPRVLCTTTGGRTYFTEGCQYRTRGR